MISVDLVPLNQLLPTARPGQPVAWLAGFASFKLLLGGLTLLPRHRIPSLCGRHLKRPQQGITPGLELASIRREAEAANGEFHWGDEMGLRSDHQAGTSYGRRGKTSVIPGTEQRFGCNMISTVTNQGKRTFMVFKERFTTTVFLRFLVRLVRQVGWKVFLIVDGHPAHRSKAVSDWVEQNSGKISLHQLPGYSPDLNPDELLNNGVKSNALGRRRPQDMESMIPGVRNYPRSRHHSPNVVINYFKHPSVAYAT